jgi:hypothetical protein
LSNLAKSSGRSPDLEGRTKRTQTHSYLKKHYVGEVGVGLAFIYRGVLITRRRRGAARQAPLRGASTATAPRASAAPPRSKRPPRGGNTRHTNSTRRPISAAATRSAAAARARRRRAGAMGAVGATARSILRCARPPRRRLRPPNLRRRVCRCGARLGRPPTERNAPRRRRPRPPRTSQPPARRWPGRSPRARAVHLSAHTHEHGYA